MLYNYFLLVGFLASFLIIFALADLVHWIIMKLKEPNRIVIDRHYQGKL